MENNEKLLLSISSTRISISPKRILFPMKYDFYEENDKLVIVMTTKNLIGQETTSREFPTFFKAKGILFRKLHFINEGRAYGSCTRWRYILFRVPHDKVDPVPVPLL